MTLQRKALRIAGSQKTWLLVILLLTAALIAGVTHSLRARTERTVQHVETPTLQLPTLSVPSVGNQVAAAAIQQYAALQESALQGVGMAPEDRAAYEKASAEVAACIGLENDQPRLADCLGEKLRFLVESSTPQGL